MMRIACGFLLVLTCQAAGTWQYGLTKAGSETSCGATETDRCGQAEWVKDNAACGVVGDQSPVDALFLNPVHLPGSAVTDLTLASAECTRTDLVVNERTFQANIAEQCPGKFKATWKGAAYDLNHIIYHSPSEHTVDGAYYAMEAHHVHEAADKSILIIAVFMHADWGLEAKCPLTSVSEECGRARFFDALLQARPVAAFTAPDISRDFAVAQLSTKTIDAYTAFMPPMDKYFYTYTGSLTRPPCTAGVQWILNPTIVNIFDSTLVLYRKIIGAVTTNKLNPALVGNPWTTPPARFTWDAKIGTNNRALQVLAPRKFNYVGVLPPWDSSASSALDKPAPISAWSLSSSEPLESDSSDSFYSSGSAASGSSGFYMAIWKWVVLMVCCMCCLIAALGSLATKKKPKPVAKPKPQPQPEVALQPLMPMTNAMPAAASYAPLTRAMPAASYAR